MKIKTIVVSSFALYLFVAPAAYAVDWGQLSIHGITLDTSFEEAERILGVKAIPFLKESDGFYDYKRARLIEYKSASFMFFDKQLAWMDIYKTASGLSIEDLYSEMTKKYGSADYSNKFRGAYGGPYEIHMCWGNCETISQDFFQTYKSCSYGNKRGKCFGIVIMSGKLMIIAVNGSVNSVWKEYEQTRKREWENKRKERQKKKLNF